MRILKKKVYIKFVDSQINSSLELVCDSVGVSNQLVLSLYDDMDNVVIRNFPLCNILQYNISNVEMIVKDKVEGEG